jgi:intracellular sulfur oxidation DsrE/DsrF family protein
MTRAMQIVFAVMLSAVLATTAFAADKMHKVAIHVDQSDAKLMNLALNNVQNVFAYYKKKGEKVTVELVAYGPGLHMFRADTSPVKNRIAALSLAEPNLQFSACGNTHRKMSKKAGKKIKLVGEATMVPSGVIRLIELQEKGYAYVRP